MKKQEILIISKPYIDNPSEFENFRRPTIGWKTYFERDVYGDYISLDRDTPRSEKIEAMELLLVQAMSVIKEIWEKQDTADDQTKRKPIHIHFDG